MRKQISVVLLLAFSFALVGAHFLEVKEKDQGNMVTVEKTVSGSHFDVAFINDAVVPVVQSNHVVHVESISFTAEGYAPMTERKARAPNRDITKENKARDKLRC